MRFRHISVVILSPYPNKNIIFPDLANYFRVIFLAPKCNYFYHVLPRSLQVTLLFSLYPKLSRSSRIMAFIFWDNFLSKTSLYNRKIISFGLFHSPVQKSLGVKSSWFFPPSFAYVQNISIILLYNLCFKFLEHTVFLAELAGRGWCARADFAK